MLPSGAFVTVELVGTDNGVAVVRVPEVPTKAPRHGWPMSPADEWTVVAFGDEFAVDGGDRLPVAERARGGTDLRR